VWRLRQNDRNLPVLVGVFHLLLLPVLLGGFHIVFWMMVFLTLLLRLMLSRPTFLLLRALLRILRPGCGR
jgi:hypothetical protein